MTGLILLVVVPLVLLGGALLGVVTGAHVEIYRA